MLFSIFITDVSRGHYKLRSFGSDVSESVLFYAVILYSKQKKITTNNYTGREIGIQISRQACARAHLYIHTYRLPTKSKGFLENRNV